MTYLYAAIAALVLAVCTGLYGAHVGHKAGAAEVQVLWDADKASIAKTAADALAAEQAKTIAALNANQGIINDYDAKLSAAGASNSDLALRLRHALGAPASCSSVPEAPGVPGTAPAGSPSGAGSVADAVAAAITESELNAAQLDALIAQIKPQL
jgi:hypothetical protein